MIFAAGFCAKQKMRTKAGAFLLKRARSFPFRSAMDPDLGPRKQALFVCPVASQGIAVGYSLSLPSRAFEALTL